MRIPSKFAILCAAISQLVTAHHGAGGGHAHAHDEELWKSKYGEQVDLPFTGPLSFSHLPYAKCLDDPSSLFDIAILGLPFDTTVTYRPGARFGPFGIRSGSRRQRPDIGHTFGWGMNPYKQNGVKIIDCGDVPISPFDNTLAIDQISVAYSTLLSRPLPPVTSAVHSSSSVTASLSQHKIPHPRIVSLGGDHTIVLPILRSLNKIYGPISVIHFDAHLDTWPPVKERYPAMSMTEQSQVNHGTFFWKASQEGLIKQDASIHAGIRCKLAGPDDLVHDSSVGFELITTDDIEDLGIPEIIKRIRRRVGSNPVYLSLDIDVIDPGLAPATGTPEAGGWTTREVKRILRGLGGLNFVGFDLVEVSPVYDTNAETTSLIAADIVHDFLSMMLQPRDEKVAAGTIHYSPGLGEGATTRDEL
ncbi:hypothetical protein FRB96_006014 [Tulasnella sp. 330]|nr:hypothetical protein FRB96_006014 [Tulasnella sp. 330]